MAARAERYTAVAIVLHWAIAAAILFQLPLGFIMHERAEHGAATQAVFDAYQLHKSIGLTVLGLSLVRLGWRLLHPPPPFPEHLPEWERFSARAVHYAFYLLMILMPLSGWIYVSAGWSVHDNAPLPVQTRWFGLFEVPHLFNLPQASQDVRADAAEAALGAHLTMAWLLIGLAVLHVAAALKHQFFDKDAVLAHMVPGLRAPFETDTGPKQPVRRAILGVGLGAVAVALIAAMAASADLFLEASRAPAVEAGDHTHGAAPEAPAAHEHAPGTPAHDDTPAAPGAPAAESLVWTVDRNASSIGFSYVYEDDSGRSPFNGRFNRWRADIRFDPDNLDASSVVVRIETASARTGVPAHDSALPTAAWFNSAAHPNAEFRSTRIRARGDGRYEARGTLAIRGQTREVDLPFTLSIDGDHASVSGNTRIDRRDFGIGSDDAGDDLISREIEITVRVEARRAQ